MQDFNNKEINKRLKILVKQRTNKKATNKNVALALGIEPSNYNTMLCRGKIPFSNIIVWAKCYSCSLEYIFWGNEKI